MDSTAAFAQLPLRLGDQLQWRYEVIRPLVLFTDRTATQRDHRVVPAAGCGPPADVEVGSRRGKGRAKTRPPPPPPVHPHVLSVTRTAPRRGPPMLSGI